MSAAGERLISALHEAVAIAKGEQPAARIWHQGFAYVPEQDLPDAIDIYRLLKSRKLRKRADIAHAIADALRTHVPPDAKPTDYPPQAQPHKQQ